MKKLISAIFLIVAFSVVGAGTIAAADFQKGVEAYNKEDYATALREWKPLAESGKAAAQRYLGLLYAQGLGVTQDNSQAFTWFSRAAEQGDAAAQHNVGVMYQAGLSVNQNELLLLKSKALSSIDPKTKKNFCRIATNKS